MPINQDLIDYLEIHVQAPLGDLEQMNQISGEFDCSIPMAMTIISNIELIGYFLNNDAKVNESKNNIKRAILSDSTIFNNEYLVNIDLLINYFRHGMMHGFFPNLKSTYNPLLSRLGIKKIKTSQRLIENDTLNVSRLFIDFKSFINKLKQEYEIVRIVEYFEVSQGINRS
ncbi:MAG: hypothetical protein IPP42_02825 [Saprospiraceae bacterium]|nr:hypothetical protein [Saprospiraceae bacterium]